MSTGTLSDFLLARIAEDEAALVDGGDCRCPDAAPQRPDCPDRIAAECEAKRHALSFVDAVQDDMERLAPEPLHVVVWEKFARILAAVYTDHPDYREEWRA